MDEVNRANGNVEVGVRARLAADQGVDRPPSVDPRLDIRDREQVEDLDHIGRSHPEHANHDASNSRIETTGAQGRRRTTSRARLPDVLLCGDDIEGWAVMEQPEHSGAPAGGTRGAAWYRRGPATRKHRWRRWRASSVTTTRRRRSR